jgi:hypothetical protein
MDKWMFISGMSLGIILSGLGVELTGAIAESDLLYKVGHTEWLVGLIILVGYRQYERWQERKKRNG